MGGDLDGMVVAEECHGCCSGFVGWACLSEPMMPLLAMEVMGVATGRPVD